MSNRNRLVTNSAGSSTPRQSVDDANIRLAKTGTGLRWVVKGNEKNLEAIPSKDFDNEKFGGTTYESGGNPAFSPAQRKLERYLAALATESLTQKQIDSVPDQWRRIADAQNLLRMDDDGVYRYWKQSKVYAA